MKTIAQIYAFLRYFYPGSLSIFSENYSLDLFNYNHCLIKNLCQDHRLVIDQDAFVALKGKVHDGHQYVNNVITKGVKLILVEDLSLISANNLSFVIEIIGLQSILAELASWFYSDPSKCQHIFSVTGTNGKSSICHFLAQSLTKLQHKVGVLGSIGNGVFPQLSDSVLTTLDNLNLQRTLKFCRDNGANIIAMEASSHAIEQQRIAKINIKTAIFSNLDVDHLDYHITMDNYFQAKLKLFVIPSVCCCVVNIDNGYGIRLYNYLIANTTKVVFSFSLINCNADYYMPIKSILTDGFEVDIFFQRKYKSDLMIPIIGEYNLSNIAATVCTLLANGYDFNKVINTLGSLHNIKGRLEKVVYFRKALVVIDYAHTADGLAKVLQALRPQTKGKLYCVFGCGGSREHSKRPVMAKIAQSYADFSIVTEDNSRTDKIQDIIKDIISGFDYGFKDFIIIEDRKQAIEYILQKALPEDVILLAGKGHETYLDINNKKIHFDEREIIANFWREND